MSEEAPEAYVAEEAEETDRKYWEKKRDPASLAVMDRIVGGLKSSGMEERLSYNKHHVALGTKGNNFCWFHPRKSDKDARKVLGKSLPQHGVHFAVSGRSELFELEKLLNDHQGWLAKKIPEWDERYLKAGGNVNP